MSLSLRKGLEVSAGKDAPVDHGEDWMEFADIDLLPIHCQNNRQSREPLPVQLGCIQVLLLRKGIQQPWCFEEAQSTRLSQVTGQKHFGVQKGRGVEKGRRSKWSKSFFPLPWYGFRTAQLSLQFGSSFRLRVASERLEWDFSQANEMKGKWWLVVGCVSPRSGPGLKYTFGTNIEYFSEHLPTWPESRAYVPITSKRSRSIRRPRISRNRIRANNRVGQECKEALGASSASPDPRAYVPITGNWSISIGQQRRLIIRRGIRGHWVSQSSFSCYQASGPSQ